MEFQNLKSGVHCEGENVYTYIMDLPSPKLFKSLDQISLLPSVITHLLCLKNVASKTATKVETASLYSYNNLKRPAPNPPEEWLSSVKAVLSRLPKKTKEINPISYYIILINNKFMCVLSS